MRRFGTLKAISWRKLFVKIPGFCRNIYSKFMPAGAPRKNETVRLTKMKSRNKRYCSATWETGRVFVTCVVRSTSQITSPPHHFPQAEWSKKTVRRRYDRRRTGSSVSQPGWERAPPLIFVDQKKHHGTCKQWIGLSFIPAAIYFVLYLQYSQPGAVRIGGPFPPGPLGKSPL